MRPSFARTSIKPTPSSGPPAAVRGWAVAVSVYVLAALHRSSLGVAGLQAERRFGISAAQLSVFVLLQIGVYAAMQIPTGVLVDRVGPRRLLITAAALMGLAQLVFAIAPSYSTALLARGMLGCGDALTFVSVLRFSAARFPPRRYPAIVAATGLLGTFGSVLATVPLSLALTGLGWAPTFATAGLLSLVAGTAVWALLPADPPSAGRLLTTRAMGAKMGRVGRRVVSAWTHPGTRLGFWVHFACMSATTTFSVLWGFPYLVTGLGLSRTVASSVLLTTVVVAALTTVAVGLLTTRRPDVRVPLAIGICVVTIAGWLVVVALPPAVVPRGFVIALVCLMGAGAPTSAVAFALARDYNRPSLVGTATGVVNVGGFAATMATSLLIGLILDVAGSTPNGFRLALLALIGVQGFGTVQVLRWWLRARNFVLAEQSKGRAVPVRVVRHRFDLG